MLKKLLFPVIAFTAAFLDAKVYLQPSLMPMHLTSTNVIVVWDIHNVLAEDEGTLNKFGKALPDLFSIIETKLFNDVAWKEIKEISRKMDISGEARYEIFLKHGQHEMARMTERAANTYRPRKGMEQIVRKLRLKGVQQRFASDIGPRFFNNLNTKFKTKHKCHMFDLIQPGKFVDYSHLGEVTRKKSVIPAELTIFCKPHPQFFTDFSNTYNTDKKWYLILIDDKLENIQAALKQGWSAGIHFDLKQDKPVQRLEKELASLNLI
jgi:hypothetical protein